MLNTFLAILHLNLRTKGDVKEETNVNKICFLNDKELIQKMLFNENVN